MSYKISIENKALKEAKDAYDYYEKKQKKLGERFNDSLNKSINLIRVNPKYYRKIRKEIRQILLDKFPFVIVFEIIEEDVIVIYAVFHTSRNPKQKTSKQN
jgi:plasmid stabilization system protein ParE